MAKKTTKKKKKAAIKPEKTGKQYAFPRGIRCPRCKANDTLQTSTQENIQYRRCQRAVCRHPFKVIGKEIVFTDSKQVG